MDDATKQILDTAESLIKERRMREALALCEGIPLDFALDPACAVRALRVRLKSLLGLREYERLLEIGTLHLPRLSDCPHASDVGPIHGALGMAYLRTGLLKQAEEHFRAAIHIAIWEVRDRSAALPHQRELAIMYKNLGRWDKARQEILDALESADSLAIADECAGLRLLLAIVSLKSGSVADTERLLAEAEDNYERSHRRNWVWNVRLVRAKLLRMTGQIPSALKLCDRILQEMRLRSDTREEAICLEYMGDCHLARRDYKKALEHFDAADKIAEATAPEGDLIPELGHRIGECQVHLGCPNEGIVRCERGLRVAKDTGDRYEECATQRVLAMAHRAAGNPNQASRIIAEGIALGRAYEIPYELARALTWSGEVRLQLNGRDDQIVGRHQLWEARAIFERIGLPIEVRSLDRVLGFEEAPELAIVDPVLGAIHGITDLDRGALRFGIVTASPDVSLAVATIQSVAPTKIPVLITGPSGVGKELLANALHQMSDRRDGPFIAVNCGGIASGTLESEFFGHGRGAFTGAVESREGLLAQADKGTLFLDEIGNFPLAAQGALLRALETGEFRPVGSDRTRRIDVRIVAATNSDLEEQIRRGAFRQDLYYRLEACRVWVPALAEREDDVRVLFRYFLAQAEAAAGKRFMVAEDVEPMLSAYDWPGNVRELRNEVGRVVAMTEDGAVLNRDDFLSKLRRKSPAALREARDRHTTEAQERERILAALRAHGGNKTIAARSLGEMNRTTLLHRMARHGIRPEEYQVKEGT